MAEPLSKPLYVPMQFIPKFNDQRGDFRIVLFGNKLSTQSPDFVFHSTQRRTTFQTKWRLY
jgi:hypothetical protein